MARAGLTRPIIAAAALELIDDVGIDRFTMRKLGARLGVDPMAVYRHYRDREDLFDGVAELILDEVGLDDLPWDGGWRAVAEQYCLQLRAALMEHPRAVVTFATRPVRSPASIATGERMVATLTREGFSAADALRIARSLRELVIGHAMSLANVQLGSSSRSRKPAPDSPDYNRLAAAADATEIDDHFELALRSILEGFARLRDASGDPGG